MSGLGAKVGSVSSRFVSQTELTEAQKKREEDMKAAYARMGKSPPPQAQSSEAEYDPRSLYERLKANKDKKQEAFDEIHKLGNQFRGIDEGESQFLAEIQAEKREEERRKKQEQEKELEEFRRAAQTREASPPNPLALLTTSSGASASSPPRSSPPSGVTKAATNPNNTSKPKGKRKREGLLGVVKKKAPSGDAAKTSSTIQSSSASNPTQKAGAKVGENQDVSLHQEKESSVGEEGDQSKKARVD